MDRDRLERIAREGWADGCADNAEGYSFDPTGDTWGGNDTLLGLIAEYGNVLSARVVRARYVLGYTYGYFGRDMNTGADIA